MKVLVGHGRPGREIVNGVTEFNWTKPGELVNVDQIVCCTSATCGCDRSFHGINSRGKTSRAVVAEIPEIQFQDFCRTVYDDAMAKFLAGNIKQSAAEKAAQYKVTCLRAVAKYCQALEVGTVVRVKKDNSGDTYEMIHE
jgi:hypothetical protein